MNLTAISKEQAIKIAKALGYVVVSAVLGALIAFVQGSPELFGVYAPIINVVLVTIKQLFTKPE